MEQLCFTMPELALFLASILFTFIKIKNHRDYTVLDEETIWEKHSENDHATQARNLNNSQLSLQPAESAFKNTQGSKSVIHPNTYLQINCRIYHDSALWGFKHAILLFAAKEWGIEDAIHSFAPDTWKLEDELLQKSYNKLNNEEVIILAAVKWYFDEKWSGDLSKLFQFIEEWNCEEWNCEEWSGVFGEMLRSLVNNKAFGLGTDNWECQLAFMKNLWWCTTV
jgi:hypothetical protein